MNNEKPITAELFQEMVDALTTEERDYFRHCVESLAHCFMPDSAEVGLLITGNVENGNTQIYQIGLSHRDATGMLSAVLASRMADVAAMNTPKEKLN